ncbi:MAG: histone deacetylase [Candidatus Methanomethylicia archaeon]|nr:histone deacetylase [Candidatus Methanomethylicia archaeon]MCX8169000.1 histone deacetylase [Candidatus Methanomethylicia archaeon]MDW7988731.1 histone deacetylase [Nitrososphaerota archaeon]
MEKVALIYSADYLKHDTGKHPESPLRLTKTIKLVEKSWLYRSGFIKVLNPRKTLEEEIFKVHSKDLLLKMKRLSESGGGNIAPETRVSKNSFEVALLAAGGGLRALELMNDLKKFFVLCRPPGHHAEYNRAKGFCLLNNVAITAKNALDKGFKRIFIFDWDAHHGDGTQKIFNDDPNVLYASIHQNGKTLYPRSGYIEDVGIGEGEGYKVNIPLPPNTTGNVAIKCFNEIIIPIIEEFKPEVILVSAGYDGHWRDKLSDLRFTIETYYFFTRKIVEISREICNGRIVAMLEGGYDLKYTPQSILTTLETLSGYIHYDLKIKMKPSEERLAKLLIRKIKNILSRYWSI